MQPMQEVALDTLTSKLYLHSPSPSRQQVQWTTIPTPPDIEARADDQNAQNRDLMEFLDVLSQYPLLGHNGIKARTGLLEYRYDAV